MTASDYKRCPQCGETKSLEGFCRESTRPSGRGAYCKPCKKERDRKYRRANRERYNATKYAYRLANLEKAREWQRTSDATEQGRARHRRLQRQYGQANPEKLAAHRAVAGALKDGRLERPASCSSCGQPRHRIEAHHPDYSKPLEVVWLCQRCHRERHPRETRT